MSATQMLTRTIRLALSTRACRCNVCGRVQPFAELANRREWRFGGEGGVADLELAECGCGNTLSRELATRGSEAAA